MIDPEPTNVGKLLQSTSRLAIPKYQRGYAWGKSESLEFMDDLKSYISPEQGSLFLGTFIFDLSEQANEPVRVVDGQQRLTTVMLLLIACREKAKRLRDQQMAQEIQNKITFKDQITGDSKGTRLIASETIREVFEHMADYQWDGIFPQKIQQPGATARFVKRQSNKLKPIYEFFEKEIRQFDKDRLIEFLKAVYETHAVRIDIKDPVEAFTIFERTNARGLDLEASDLLKNFLFAKGVEGIEENWSQIVDNSDGTLLRMLKYFYIANRGSVSRADLYKKIRKYSDDVGPSQLAGELLGFSHFYSTIRNSDAKGIQSYMDQIGFDAVARDEGRYEKIYLALEGLRLFKVVQIYPLVYAALMCALRNDGGNSTPVASQFIDLLGMLERYHFVNNVICDRVGNEVEKLYADSCVEYADSKDFILTTKQLLQQLKGQSAGSEEFVSRFTEITYSSDSIPLIVYIFDRINNYKLEPGDRLRLFNPDPRILRRNHNIEHFYPKTAPTGDIVEAAEMKEVVDNIGNLLVIGWNTNIKLGNGTPIEKAKRLRGDLQPAIQNKRYVADFLTHYCKERFVWDRSIIDRRAHDLANDAYDRIWKID